MVQTKPVFIVDEIGAIVNSVSAELTAQFKLIEPTIEGVHYLHGHPLEIIETLKQRDKSEAFTFKKYPLVALFQDFNETYSVSPDSYFASNEVNLHIIIAKATSPDYKAPERYDKNFKPFLYPIYMSLKQKLFESGKFLIAAPELISHTKTDRLYWGRQGLYGNEGNIFDDWLDIIELTNLKLKTDLKFC